MSWEHTSDADLAAFVEGALAEDRLVDVALHLDECPQCTGRLQQLDDLHLLVAASADPPVPDDLAARCWDAVCDDAAAGPVDAPAPAGLPVVREPTASSAIAVAAVLGASAAGLLLTAGAPAGAAETVSAATLAVGALARALGLGELGVSATTLGISAVTIASTVTLIRRGRAA